jgi:coproporphyrinogen III oxidase-like Fe-S oxidoreductase
MQDYFAFLISLKLNGCVSDDTTLHFGFLLHFVGVNQTIQDLYVCGNSRSRLSNQNLTKLFNTLRQNSVLKSVTFSSHNYSPQSLKLLENVLCEIHSIERVNLLLVEFIQNLNSKIFLQL